MMFGKKATDGASERIVYVVDDESEVRRSIGFFPPMNQVPSVVP